jgi:hypothetical protein
MPTKPPPIPEFNVPVADVPTGLMTAVWWEWFQRFLRWDEECCADGDGDGGGGGAVSSVSGTPPVVVSGTALLLDEEPIAETMAAGNVTVSMPAATGSVNGYLKATDWTTFNGKADASHTHTAAQITDFSEATDDRVAALLVAGTNVTLNYNDAAGSLTVNAAGGGSGVTDGDKGDIVVSSSGATWLFDSSVVTPAAKTVLDDATVAAMRTTLGAAPLASPVFTGDPQAPTPTAGDSDTSIATTGFVANAVSAIGVGGMSTAEYTYSTTTGVPPSTGQLRANTTTQTAITQFYLHETNAVGIDITNALKIIATGVKVLVQDKTNAANVQYYVVSGPAVDNGVYFTIPVTWVSTSSGTPFTAGRVIFAGFGIGSNNMPEAPADGQIYGRRGSDTSWQVPVLASMPAYTFKANNTSGTAAPTDVTIAGLTTKASPTTADWLMISDTAATGAFKKVAWPTGTSTPATVAPLMDGVAAVGTTSKYAREDHVHPSDTARVAKAGDTMTGSLTIDGATDRVIQFTKAGKNTWGLWDYQADGNFYITRSNATTGAEIDSPLTISGSTGLMTAGKGLVLPHEGVAGFEYSSSVYFNTTNYGGNNTYMYLTHTVGVAAYMTFVVGSSSATMKLDNLGNLSITGTTGTKASGTTWANPSDARVKEDIHAYPQGLAAICGLRPVMFRFKSETKQVDDVHVGLIAQEAEQVMPGIVTTAPGGLGDLQFEDFKSLDASNVIWALVNSCRQLKEMNEALDARLRELEGIG